MVYLTLLKPEQSPQCLHLHTPGKTLDCLCGFAAGMLQVQSIVAGVVGRAILAEQCGWFRILQPKPLKTLG